MTHSHQHNARNPRNNAPKVIIHNSLAQNLQLRNASLGMSVTSVASGAGAHPVLDQLSHSSPNSSSGLATPVPNSVSSVSERTTTTTRTANGTQTPREMVWVDSKERLSEMATNIRGISNALSNVALAVQVKSVMIVTKLSDETLVHKTREIAEWLLDWQPGCSQREKQAGFELNVKSRSWSHGGIKVFVQDVLAQKPEFGLDSLRERRPHQTDSLQLWTSNDVQKHAEDVDLVISLGGDGTVLYTSWLFQKMVPPTLSFGLGSLGFMTENSFEDFERIVDEHLTKGICCALRMRFECSIMRTRNPEKKGCDDLEKEMLQAGENCHFTTHTRDGEYTILNEVVVDRGPNPFVTTTELYGNYELLTSIKADGVVISTPTGSTAYSMSTGGSLVHPDIPAQLISPICPHTLSFRPLIVPDSMVLHIGVPYDARSSAFVSFDGKARVELNRGDVLAINVSAYPFPKVLQEDYQNISWVQQLSRTLHWNEQKRPKRYDGGFTDNWSS